MKIFENLTYAQLAGMKTLLKKILSNHSFNHKPQSGPPRKQRGPGKKVLCAQFFQLINYLCRRGQLINGVGSTRLNASECFYTNRESITDYSTQAFTQWVQTMRKTKKQHEDAAHNGKNHENKSLMGPLKSLGAPGKYPLFPPPPPPPRWAWPQLAVGHTWVCVARVKEK